MTQKELIIKYLKSQEDWVYGYTLAGKNTPLGFIGSQADRRLRELAEKGEVERRISGKFVQYRAKNDPVYIKKDNNTVIQL